MHKSDFEFESSEAEVKAGAFDVIANYIHGNYDKLEISSVTPDEAFFCAVVKTTEQLLASFRPREEY